MTAIVYFHGRGSDEREADLARPLFGPVPLRSYRGPLSEGGGFCWFRNQAIGVAIEASLAHETRAVGAWLAADDRGQPPWLCGFSNGAAMAAHLLLAHPERYAGLIMIAGCFAVSDDALPPNGLSGKPVLFCRGRDDRVIPRRKFEQAEAYLGGSSGATATFLAYDGGHELPLTSGAGIRRWLSTYAPSGGKPS